MDDITLYNKIAERLFCQIKKMPIDSKFSIYELAHVLFKRIDIKYEKNDWIENFGDFKIKDIDWFSVHNLVFDMINKDGKIRLASMESCNVACLPYHVTYAIKWNISNNNNHPLAKVCQTDTEAELCCTLFCKLGLGNINEFFNEKYPIPNKNVIATENNWPTEPMSFSKMKVKPVHIMVESSNMEIIKSGHIPESFEDNWFMYCDEKHIRYYRSWTGECFFVAHYKKVSDKYLINNLTINQDITDFYIDMDETATYLFEYLINAECNNNPFVAWEKFFNKWKKNRQQNLQIIQDKKSIKKTKTKEIPDETWYVGKEKHICEECIYANGITRRGKINPDKWSKWCGRLSRNVFKSKYLSGNCEYKKTDLFTPSEYERKNEHHKLVKDKQKKEIRNDYHIFKKCTLAGGAHHGLKLFIDKLHPETTLLLERDTENKYDQNAVSVNFYDEGKYHMIGYIPKICNKEIASLFDMGWGELLECKVSRINMEAHPEQQIYLTIFIKNKNKNTQL